MLTPPEDAAEAADWHRRVTDSLDRDRLDILRAKKAAQEAHRKFAIRFALCMVVVLAVTAIFLIGHFVR